MQLAPKDRRKVDEVKAVVGEHASDKEVLKVLKSLRWDVQAGDGGTGAVANNFGQWGDNVGSTVVEILADRTVRIERCV